MATGSATSTSTSTSTSIATATATAYQLSAISQLHKLEKSAKNANNYRQTSDQLHKYGDWPTEMAVAVASDK